MRVTMRMGGALVLSAAMLAGCGGNKDNNTGAGGDTAAPAGTVGQAGTPGGAGTAEGAAGTGAGTGTAADSAGGANGTATLSDPEIISLTQASDEGEIATSKIAVTKATNADVKRYAQQMIAVHTRMISQRNGQMKATGAKPAAGAKDSSVQMVERMVSALNAAPKGVAFDTAYVNGQVMSHQNSLAMVEKAQAQAKDPALKSFLNGAKPDIQKHLEEARALQGKLAGGAGSAGAARGASSGDR